MAGSSTWPRLLGVLLVLFVLNWLCLRFWNYPLVYCWGQPIRTLYEPWSLFVNMMLLVWFCYCVLKHKWQDAVFSAMTLVFVNLVPQLITKYMGGPCG